jgi:hypothetical protein
VLQVEVEGTGEHRRLHAKADVRVWQRAPGGFHAKMDGRAHFFEHWIDLEPWEASNVADEPPTTIPEVTAAKSDARLPSVEAMSVLREIGIRFYGLSFSQKSEIAGRLQLLEEEDMTQPDFERFRRVFLRASERNKLAELKQAIEEAERQPNR